MKKVIIVDDEAAGRHLIKEYLQAYPDLIVLGEANNGVDAVRIINEFQPDLVFLDIQMPGLSGFEVLEKLDEIPEVIFSTAYDQYALRAFEVHAVDYLLKPYTRERFSNAVNRYRKHEGNSGLAPLAESIIMDKPSYPVRILIQSAKKLKTIAVENIVQIQADGDYSRIVTENHSYLSSYGISKLEDKLNPEMFIRIHRSTIINIHHVKEVEKYPNSYDVLLSTNETVRVSRSYMDKLKSLMF
ncbi:MAG: LytTR family DNA-binding domain-containing protein [Bacteroidia bacterium]|nr:LytTR family DNA-binding domain-containing protein [Bacteroidia bacterium]